MSKKSAFIFMSLLSFTIIASFYFIEYSEKKAFNHKNALHIAQQSLSEFLMLRRHEKDYLSRHHPIYIENHKHHAGQLNQELEHLYAASSGFKGRQQQIEYIQQELTQYLSTFQDITELQTVMGATPHQGLYGQLRASAHQLEHILSEHQQQAALNVLLRIRKTEKDFMLHPSPQHLKTFYAQLTGLKNMVSQLPLNPQQQTEFNLHLTNYQNSFSEYAAISLKKGGTEQDGYLGDLRKHAKLLEEQITKLKQDIVKDSINSEFQAYSQARVLSIAFPMLILLLALVPFALNTRKKELI